MVERRQGVRFQGLERGGEEMLERFREGEIRIPSGCAIAAVVNRNKTLMSSNGIVSALALMRDRSNGLGGGFAAYGIYPEYANFYALHVFYDSEEARERGEKKLRQSFEVVCAEEIPTRRTRWIKKSPLVWRYFGVPREEKVEDWGAEEEAIVDLVMEVNSRAEGMYIFSSGKNMGAFKGVGFPEEMAEFYRLEDYKGYIWTGHGRFPTNTPGWWGGAHPFCLLDWSIVHNGELSSYGTNRAYLEMFGYACSLQTDTEVITYVFDLLMRRHRLSLHHTVQAVCPPFWERIAAMATEEARVARAIRLTYPAALLNGPFSIVVATGRGIMGLNDRIKLRPMTAGVQGELLAVASEEAAVRVLCPAPEEVWQPGGGEPVLGLVKGAESLWP